MPNLGAIGSNAIFCEYVSGLGLGRPILPGAEDVEIRLHAPLPFSLCTCILRICDCKQLKYFYDLTVFVISSINANKKTLKKVLS